MINQISHNLTGVANPQRKGGSDSASRVSGSQGVEPSKVQASGDSVANSPVDAAKQAKPSEENLTNLVEDLNQYAQTVRRQLQFSVDEESGETLVKVLDAETGETIRQIPAEEVLNMQKRLREVSDLMFGKDAQQNASLLFNGKA